MQVRVDCYIVVLVAIFLSECEFFDKNVQSFSAEFIHGGNFTIFLMIFERDKALARE
jgi:hypothetical protein